MAYHQIHYLYPYNKETKVLSQMRFRTTGATTAERLRGTKVWVPTPGRAGCWVQEGVAPSRCEGPGESPPENFWKLRCSILHSGDYLLWNFVLFENYGQEVGGPIHYWSPQPESWGTSLPRSLRLLRLCFEQENVRENAFLNGNDE